MTENELTFGQQPVANRMPPAMRTTPPPMVDLPVKRNPVLSRADMVEVIRKGGAIAHGGQVIAHEHLLPTAEELAQDDEAEKARLVATHEALIAHSRARLDVLNKPAAKGGEGDVKTPKGGDGDAKPPGGLTDPPKGGETKGK